MKLKRILAIVLCFAMVLSTMSFSVYAAADVTVNGADAVDLQSAINYAYSEGGNVTVTLNSDFTGNVVITEKVGLYLTIEGNGNAFNGKITIEPLSDTNANRRITIQNVNFVDNSDANVDFISVVKTNHYPRITVAGCSFKGSGNDGDVALRLKSSSGAVIEECVGTGLHSFLQNTAGWNLSIENVEVTDSKSGFALGTVQGVTVKDCDIDVDGYGIRVDAQYNNEAVIADNTVNAFIPVVVRKAEVNTNIKFEGTNEMIASNTDGIWCAIGSSEYEENGKLPTPPAAEVNVLCEDEDLTDGISGYTSLNGVVPTVPTGKVNPCYTAADRFWGESSANAEESFEIKIYEGEKEIASASLNNIGGIINGNVNVSWYIPFNGIADEYWNVKWEEGYPKYDMNPTAVKLFSDGVKVSEDGVRFNAADDLNKIVALAEDASGNVKAYTKLEDAVAAASKVCVVRDTTLADELTLPANITFNGNGKNITGNLVASGNVTFEGDTKVSNFNAGYSKPVITIGKGASLELTEKSRMVIGHGATFNITGEIEDAKIAAKAKVNAKPSLIMPGASFTGAGVNFNVTDAYISVPSSYASTSKIASGTFNFNFENSLWGSAGKLAFEAQSTNATVNFNLKDSVLNTGSHLLFSVEKGEIVIDNSIVNEGNYKQFENCSTTTIKNGSVVYAAVATSSNAKNPGTLIVDNATFISTGEFSGSDLGIGTLIVKKGAKFSAGSITKANIIIDATGLTAGDSDIIVADLSKFEGTLSTVAGNRLSAKIENGKIVLENLPAAKIGSTEYYTLAEAFKAAQDGDIVTILPGEYDSINISNKNITVQGTVGANGELLTTIKGGNPAIKGHGFNGTIKDIKIVDAWKVMYAEPAGNVTVDNVYVEGATYGFHLVAYSKGLKWIIQNSYMDLAWANSLGVYNDGDADIIIRNNTFESTSPYYPDYGTLPVNSFLPSLTVENNIFGEGAKIYIDKSVTDTSKVNISKNYHADGIENAFADDADTITVQIPMYYTEIDSEGNLAGLVDARQAKINDVVYNTLDEAFKAAQDGDTITLLTDAAPALTSQRAITKASVIDLNGNKLTLTEDDLYFGITTFKKGEIVVDPSVKASTAVFWMFKDQTLTFDNVKLTATGVTGTYLIGLDGNNSDLNLLNGSEIIVDNDTALDLDIICVNASTGNDIIIDNSKVNVKNLDGRVFFRGNYTIRGNSDIDLEGITKAGFRIEEGQSLNILDTATVDIVGEPRDGGIHIAKVPATYYKADTATVNASVKSVAVAKIGSAQYATLKDALAAAKDGETVTLIWNEGDAPIAMDGAVFGKTITVTGDATVDWNKGFLFIGRGGEGNGTVIFDNANLKSASNSSSYGIHVSGREKDTTNKYNGTLVINNSTIELDYLINKGTMTLDNSTLTVKNGFSVGGRPAIETESGVDATATIDLKNGSKVVVNNHNGMGLGYEAVGVMNIDETSAFECTQDFLITSKGRMYVNGGSVNVNGKLNVNGTLKSNGNVYADITAGSDAVIEINGGLYSEDVSEWCVDGYKCKATKKGKYFVYPEFVVEAIADVETAVAGETITVQVKVTKGGNYTNADWTLKYDPRYVTYTDTDAKNYKISGKVYDGTPNDGYDEFDADDALGTYTFTVNELTTESTAVFEIVDAYVHNYAMSIEFDGVEASKQNDSVAIKFKTVDREIVTKPVDYNGMEQRGNTVTNAPANATITYSETEDFTNGTQLPPAFVDAGTHTYYAQIKLDGYATKVVEGKLVIDTKDVEPSVEWMVAPESDKVEFIPVIKGVVDDSYKNKGGKVTVTGQKADGTAFEFEFDASEFAYDGHGKAVYTGAAIELSGIKGNELLEVTVKYIAGTADNYANGEDTASVYVNKSTIDDTMEDKLATFIKGEGNVVYDGQTHYVTVDAAELAKLGWIATVATHNGVTYYGDVEVVDVTFTDTTGMYNDYTATVMIKTIRRNTVIYVNNATKKNGQADSEATGWGYTAVPVVIGTDLGEIKVVRADGKTDEVQGSYPITATYTPNDNYIVRVENGTLTIFDAVIKIEVVDNAHNGNEVKYGADTKSDYTAGSVANGNIATKMILVHTDADYAFFTYKGEKMYDVTDAGYSYVNHNYAEGTHVTEKKYQHVYAIVVDAEYGDVTSEVIEAKYASHLAYAGKDATAAYAPVKVTYDADINDKSNLHTNDYSTVKGVYGGIYSNSRYQISILKADYNKDKIVNTADAIDVKNAVIGE